MTYKDFKKYYVDEEPGRNNLEIIDNVTKVDYKLTSVKYKVHKYKLKNNRQHMFRCA